MANFSETSDVGSFLCVDCASESDSTILPGPEKFAKCDICKATDHCFPVEFKSFPSVIAIIPEVKGPSKWQTSLKSLRSFLSSCVSPVFKKPIP